MASTPAAIDVYIRELILHGVSAADRLGIGEALQHELSRLLAEHGLPRGLATGRDIEALDGESIRMTPGLAAGRMGTEIAAAVYGGLRR